MFNYLLSSSFVYSASFLDPILMMRMMNTTTSLRLFFFLTFNMYIILFKYIIIQNFSIYVMLYLQLFLVLDAAWYTKKLHHCSKILWSKNIFPESFIQLCSPLKRLFITYFLQKFWWPRKKQINSTFVNVRNNLIF